MAGLVWVLTDVQNGQNLIRSADPRAIAEIIRTIDKEDMYEDEAVLELTVEEAT